ncbi:hypothetical protein GQ457_02G016880 [Hibiscus cannabinus]
MSRNREIDLGGPNEESEASGRSLARGKQGSKGDQVKPLFKYAQISAILVLSIGTLSGVSIPKSNTGIWVSVPAREGIGTPCITPVGIGTKGGVSVPKPLWDLSIDTGFRVPIPAA